MTEAIFWTWCRIFVFLRPYIIACFMKFDKIKVNDEDQIFIPRAEGYRDCLELIRSDIYRHGGIRFSTFRIFVHMLAHPFSLLVWQRLCGYKGMLYYLCKFMHRLCCNLRQIDLPIETRIGFGLYLGHKRCMVINGGTIIGNNVNLFQFLNIGTEHNTPAIIGDEVYVGPNVCIVERVCIGSKSSIGAGAVVTKDVPTRSTCAGVPAKVLNYKEPGRLIKNCWEVPTED